MTENLPPAGENPPEAKPADAPPSANRWDERADRHARRAAERLERRHERWAAGSSIPWLGGALLIVLGCVFLAQNLGLLDLGNWNWWALFILVPAVAALANVWSQYRTAGAWSHGARGSLIGGLFLTLIAVVFLFGMDVGKIWPIFLILAGIGALLSALAG